MSMVNTTNTKSGSNRELLERVARRAMIERGLEPDFPAPALAELQQIHGPATASAGVQDLRALPWCSIDNDDSRDLDQLTVAETLPGGASRLRVAIADVGALVPRGAALDKHAHANTTSVYTPARIFPMLPERLSTDLTSLNLAADRIAIVIDLTVNGETVGDATVSRAWVRNQAKLAYNGTGAWLEDRGPMPQALAAIPGLADNLKLQNQITQALKNDRFRHGALELDTAEVRAQFDGDAIGGLAVETRNRAKELIEDTMIAANGAIARFLTGHGFPVLRRVLRSPERWARIVEVAAAHDGKLPGAPDAHALHDFLLARRTADPVGFPDLSLAIIKLLGRGEYVASFPGEDSTGHFGLAVSQYTHSTAPNRRYPDLVTQRLITAALAGASCPYARADLTSIASECTLKEDAAQKVERLVQKAAAACMLAPQIGHEFDAIVTGVGPKGTWARVFDPPVEGRVERGAQGLDVGDHVRLQLIHTDAERGFIDFARVDNAPAAEGRPPLRRKG